MARKGNKRSRLERSKHAPIGVPMHDADEQTENTTILFNSTPTTHRRNPTARETKSARVVPFVDYPSVLISGKYTFYLH